MIFHKQFKQQKQVLREKAHFLYFNLYFAPIEFIISMFLQTKNRYLATTMNKILDKGLTPWHPPTTDCWPIGQGLFPKQVVKVYGWNINGFRSMLEKGHLSRFMNKYNPDFMCLNQTKIDYKSFLNLQSHKQNPFHNYQGYWNFCKIKAGYSGVAIFTKHKPIRVIEDFPNLPQYSLQGRVITLQYDKFFIINTYNPCSGLNLQRLAFRTLQFDLAFKSHINQLRKSKPVIIFGDMNVAHNQIDLAKPSDKERYPGFTKQERSNFTSFLQDSKLLDTYRHIYPQTRKYSWWNYRTYARKYNDGWRIDYILADCRLRVLRAAIHDEIMGSDHCPVSAAICIDQQQQQTIK